MAVTIGELLRSLGAQLRQSSETGSLDSQVLVAHYMQKSRSWVLAHPEVNLDQPQYDRIKKAAHRLLQGEPLPYVIGHWEFFGMDFDLTPAVLIPRPETELLVGKALEWLRQHPKRRKVVDIGTGSGCIGLSLARHLPGLSLLMTDISPEALEIARSNAEKHHLTKNIELKRADLLEAIDRPFDLICANLPYIPTSLLLTLPAAEREPTLALDGGESGTRMIKKLLEQANNLLVCGGLLLLEIESSQGETVTSMARSIFPFSRISMDQDLAGHDRCVEIERPNLIVHLCHRQDWRQAQQNGVLRNASLQNEGFIHCSQPEQILEVANRFYRGLPDLTLLWLDPDKVSVEIRWETADGVQFPHIYGPINLEAIIDATSLNPDPDGTFRSIQLPDQGKTVSDTPGRIGDQ